MIERIKDITFYLAVGYIAIGVSGWLESSFLSDWLRDDLITLLVALLAINTTTSSVLMTKLKDISDATGADFHATIQQLRSSIFEQIFFIVIAAIVLILISSQIVLGLHESTEFVLNGLLASVFVAAIHSLSDTANSIFVILRYENMKK